MDWLLRHPTDEYTHAPRSAGSTFIHACVFFCPIYAYIRRSTLSSSLPFLTHIRGHMVRTSLPSSLPCVPSCNREKKKTFRIKLPSLTPPCVELVCIHETYQYSTQHAGCEAFSAVSLYTDAFGSGLDLDPNKHTTSYLLIIYLWCTFTCNVSISCDISHDIGVEISRTYSRY